MEMRNCSIESCENKYLCKGFCQKHYKKNKKYGEPLAKDKQTEKDQGMKIELSTLDRALLAREDSVRCRTFWGTHGCVLKRGHAESHTCSCCICPDHSNQTDDVLCVAKSPFYGPKTIFYGEDS
jgi:hypothetical protein